MAARLKSRYEQEIRPALIERFGYSTPMQAPVIEKITLNMGVGEAKQDSKMLEAATEQLATIAGQRPSVRRARKSIAAFKLREGMPVGLSVTLRGERGYEFLDRLMSVAIPRIRDFRGMSPRSFDGRGNYSLGVREQIIFPEIDYDSIDQTRGLNITITTSARTDEEALALLEAFGFPFARDEAGDAALRQTIADEDAAAAAAANGGATAAQEQEQEPEAVAEPEAEAEPDADAIAEPETETEAVAEPVDQPEAAEAEADPEPEAEVEAAAEPEAEAEAEPEAEASAESEAGAGAEDDPAGSVAEPATEQPAVEEAPAEADAELTGSEPDGSAEAQPSGEPDTTVEGMPDPSEAEAPRAGAPSNEAEAEQTDDQEQ